GAVMYRRISKFMQLGPARSRRAPRATSEPYEGEPIDWEPRRPRRLIKASRNLPPRETPSIAALHSVVTPNWQHLVRRAAAARKSKPVAEGHLRELADEVIAAWYGVTDAAAKTSLKKELDTIFRVLEQSASFRGRSKRRRK